MARKKTDADLIRYHNSAQGLQWIRSCTSNDMDDLDRFISLAETRSPRHTIAWDKRTQLIMESESDVKLWNRVMIYGIGMALLLMISSVLYLRTAI